MDSLKLRCLYDNKIVKQRNESISINLFEKISLTIITSMFISATGTQALATPEQPMDGEFSLESYADEVGLDFTPPTFDYLPTSADKPLIEPTTWHAIGQNAVVVGDYENALVAFDKAVQLSPEADPEMLEQRGWLHYSLGYEEAALQDMSKAANLHLDEKNYSAHSNVLQMREFVEIQLDS